MNKIPCGGFYLGDGLKIDKNSKTLDTIGGQGVEWGLVNVPFDINAEIEIVQEPDEDFPMGTYFFDDPINLIPDKQYSVSIDGKEQGVYTAQEVRLEGASESVVILSNYPDIYELMYKFIDGEPIDIGTWVMESEEIYYFNGEDGDTYEFNVKGYQKITKQIPQEFIPSNLLITVGTTESGGVEGVIDATTGKSVIIPSDISPFMFLAKKEIQVATGWRESSTTYLKLRSFDLDENPIFSGIDVSEDYNLYQYELKLYIQQLEDGSAVIGRGQLTRTVIFEIPS